MKECFQCRGTVEKIAGSITIEGITIRDIVFEECQQCHEQYFDVKTTAFIQEVTKFIKTRKEELLLEQNT